MIDYTGYTNINHQNERYIVLEYNQVENESEISDEELMSVSKKFIQKNKQAYEVLAK